MNSQKRKWKENIEMILQTNDHVTFIKSIIRNASEEGRCVNEIESEEIANSLKAMLQECDDLENCMVTANQNTIKYESLIMKLNELMNCISEYPWVLDTAIDGIGELIVIFYTTQKPPYSYEVELKDGSIEESFDCYEKDEKKICEIDLEKKVVVDYWKIEK